MCELWKYKMLHRQRNPAIISPETGAKRVLEERDQEGFLIERTWVGSHNLNNAHCVESIIEG